MEKLVPNCLGHVEFKLGLIDSDRYVDPIDLLTGVFEECDKNESIAVGAILELPGFGNPQIVHLAWVDKSCPGMVTDRWKVGSPVRTLSEAESLSEYQDSYFKIAHFKLRNR